MVWKGRHPFCSLPGQYKHAQSPCTSPPSFYNPGPLPPSPPVSKLPVEFSGFLHVRTYTPAMHLFVGVFIIQLIFLQQYAMPCNISHDIAQVLLHGPWGYVTS